ncbi:outer membrane assembly protein AsmA [Candidatus Regiella insecticola]|uniref:Outer membrane assembly protein AsmA n=1 Tax=Candidatus Regiella insecticola TaxID=138073 RepID=A0A6L2ZPW0_9ENTR|nr:outer membrane assembly protein AsmA [Candidatus Regiella insecticola]GFN46248.1 outer membrane assembly protein AsmA [Candidatus Regiella insecticola]
MRKLLTILIILLTMSVSCMATLVLLVNPNDFRAEMVKQVKKKMGYQLHFDGNLRWHVGAQLSIIAGRITLTSLGAEIPVVSAENIRLDVKLWPLLFQRLEIKEVMLKAAVINLIPESKSKETTAASNHFANADFGWELDISRIKLVDSLLIWQQVNNEQINIRNLNLDLTKNNHHVKVLLSSQVNRNQRDLIFSLVADLDLQHYPQTVNANVNQLSYRLEGADIPVAGISGEGSMQASYQSASRTVMLKKIDITANDNTFKGNAQAELGDIPHYLINLTAQNINLDTLLEKPSSKNHRQEKAKQPVMAPVIAFQKQSHLRQLRDFNARVTLMANRVLYRGITINKFELVAENKQGKLVVNRLLGDALKGNFSLPYTIDITGNNMKVAIESNLNQMELGPLFQAIGLPKLLTGKGSIWGKWSAEAIDVEALNQNWQGYSQFVMEDAQLHGINIPQLIQQTVSNRINEVPMPEHYVATTSIRQLRADFALHQGILHINNLSGDSALLSLKGNGEVNLPMQQCDMNLNVRLIQAWPGKADLIKTLQNTDIPLHIYGPWQKLQYQLDIESLLQEGLKQKAKKAFDDWMKKSTE